MKRLILPLFLVMINFSANAMYDVQIYYNAETKTVYASSSVKNPIPADITVNKNLKNGESDVYATFFSPSGEPYWEGCPFPIDPKAVGYMKKKIDEFEQNMNNNSEN